jgi:hypothetical protein
VCPNQFKTHKLMKEKELYISPETEVVEIKAEGVICTSAPGFRDGGDLDDVLN